MTLERSDWFYILLIMIDAFFMARPYLYAIQQDNYRISEIFKSRRLKFVYLFDLIAAAVFTGIWGACYKLGARAFWGFLATLFFFITEFALYFMEDLPNRKKPLRYTKRAVRCLVFVTIAVTAVMTCAFAKATYRLTDKYLRFVVFYCYPIVYPALFMISASIINVFERLNNRRYVARTTRRLAASPCEKVAITGSYAKTSVKNFLSAILLEKFNVLSTPASYNTPMGISKTVANLDDTYDIFVAEMGARRVGDIRTLMRVIRPAYTLVTGVNDQHLETFRKRENIIREKLRALEIPADGVAVINSSLKESAEEKLMKMKTPPQVIYAGLDQFADVRAENLEVSERGSDFDIVIGGESYAAHTDLIGRHNVENIILAVAMAYAMGVEIPYILHAVEELEAVPHRMQLIEGNGIKIIDDSFNSNPDGAAMALDTLSLFDRRRVVLTPGLVELGSAEKEENYKLGRHMSEVADLVMLVGPKRTDPIRRGLIDGGFGGEIHIYDSLKDAEDDFKNRLHMDDILLILNDLPDIYDEKL